MLYDNVAYLSDIFLHFLLDHPDVLHDSTASAVFSPAASYEEATKTTLSQRLEEWLDRETTITEPTHRATLAQLAASYEAIADMRDTCTTSVGL